MNPGTPSLLRGINDRAALDLLLEHGPLSRSQLGELTGLSKPTAAQLLTRLAEAGLVITSGNTHGGPGRAPSCTPSTRMRRTSPPSTSRRPGSWPRSRTSPAAPSASTS